jgi:hypothetical protein
VSQEFDQDHMMSKVLDHIFKDENGTTPDANTANDYGQFCEGIEQLSHVLACSADELEERMFSKGHGKGAWRDYLRRTDGLG